MRLGTKIFAASAGALLALSGLTLALVRDRVTRAEESRIRATLRADLDVLLRELSLVGERAGAVVDPQIAEMRVFLDDPRDNFVPFARDFRSWLAATSGRAPWCEAVLIAGQGGETLALDAEPRLARLRLEPSRFPPIAQVIDTARRAEYVSVIDGRAFDATILPIKRLDRDDFAAAAVVVLAAVDEGWLARVRPPVEGEGLVLAADGRVLDRTLPAPLAQEVVDCKTCLGEGELASAAGGERWLVFAHEFASPASPSARLILARSLDAELAPLRALMRDLAAAAAGLLLVVLLVAALFARRLAHPLASLARATRRIVAGDLDFKVDASSARDEIGELARAFDGMIDGLRERERIKETFGKYVAPAIVEDLLRNPQALALGGERRALTVYFSDIKGFTTLSESMPPEELVRFLNRYLTAMTEAISAAGGIVDKYIGDAVVAFWTRPFHEGNHALAACRAALANQRTVKEVRQTFEREDLRRLEIRIGLSTGEAVVGNIGSNQIRGYTAIGDIVNLGARLEGQNKSYGTGILISEATRALAGDGIVACELDLIRVVGKKQPVRVYELVGLAGEVETDELDAVARFERALARYRERRFEDALALLGGAGEGASSEPETTRRRTRRAREAALAERCRACLAAPPPEGWDGVFEATSK
jgi:class 3 adenylate cyclase